MSDTGGTPKEISDKLRGVYETARMQARHDGDCPEAFLCSHGLCHAPAAIGA
ncbi:MAG: hypothetical protein E7L01_30010 [Paenibacillus macerans]|uniref:Uncharacterized protein n=1 Tax=Paenibacillus macerans TaxID=44252 RepID=A0A6N8F2K4_PAEMA|nr:hypothetical protein [Paenibacillus macerans]MBS5910821.1 hypothetical protein [Paenibacillus macerans]MCY7560914.1 hypothetical protein [Paenibacillus macerans]MDU5947166.1 hypothetical protein [Paenibacillus macerans]MDU7477539.1 hypothetical protein [Paenibacillus macerans]MEC0139027.1 hypothetical protein [Paenibacillus macerans]